MQFGNRSYDPEHRKQSLTYIGLTKENQTNLWPDLDLKPAKQISLFYMSRQQPRTTHEYLFEYNQAFMSKGRAKIKVWQENFLEEKLPPRPKDWKWTEYPCKYCPVKPVCKQDHKDGVTHLAQSNAIDHAQQVRGEYDYSGTREAVTDRWT
jgi:hypothetical protein